MVYLERAGYCLLVVIVGIAVAGCDGGGVTLVKVTGKVVDGGQPVELEGGYEEGGNCVEVEFVPLDQSGSPKSGAPAYFKYAAEDGSFVMSGDEGKGIPKGKYRVCVYRRGAETDHPSGDAWEGKFNRENSPFEFDVSRGKELVIDISNPPG
jgi:hypothetical protein